MRISGFQNHLKLKFPMVSKAGFFCFFFSLACNLSLSSRHQKIIKCNFLLFQMITFSLKWRYFSLKPHFEWNKLSDDFLMATWEQEVEKQRKKRNRKIQPKRLLVFWFSILNLTKMMDLKMVWVDSLLAKVSLLCKFCNTLFSAYNQNFFRLQATVG